MCIYLYIDIYIFINIYFIAFDCFLKHTAYLFRYVANGDGCFLGTLVYLNRLRKTSPSKGDFDWENLTRKFHNFYLI